MVMDGREWMGDILDIPERDLSMMDIIDRSGHNHVTAWAVTLNEQSTPRQWITLTVTQQSQQRTIFIDCVCVYVCRVF